MNYSVGLCLLARAWSSLHNSRETVSAVQVQAWDQATKHIRRTSLLVTKGIATRSKDATRGSWPYY